MDDPAEIAAEAPKAAEAAILPADPASAASAPDLAADAAPELSPEAVAIERKLQAWLSSHIAGGPIARATDCWNALHEALPRLRDELLKGD
jgi:hypothetical protein